MKLRNISTSLLLIWSIASSQLSTGSTGAIPYDLNVDIVLAEKRPLHIKPEVTVDVNTGSAAALQCDEATEGLVRWWQTPFGSFGDGQFTPNDPIGVKNGTLRILRATSSHAGLYHCHLEDSRGTTVIPYRVNVVGKTKHDARLRAARDAEEIEGHELAAGVVPAVLVSFAVAFTLGAFSRPFVIKCLQKTQAKVFQKRLCCTHRTGGRGLFRKTTSKTALVFGDSGVPEASTPTQSSENHDDGVETEIEDGAQSRPEEQDGGICIQPKRRSRVIKVYNYDEEGKRYDHLTDPEVVMVEEEAEPKPRHRVMSLTRLSTIMSQVEAPDFSTSRKSRDNSPAKPDNPET